MLGLAIVLGALCALSSIAHAHPGHGAHESAAIATSAYAEDIDFLSDVDFTDVQSPGMARSELRPAPAAQQPVFACFGITCCGNAACAACDVVTWNDASHFPPTWTSAPPFGVVRVAGDGIRPHDLLRPPRSFG